MCLDNIYLYVHAINARVTILGSLLLSTYIGRIRPCMAILLDPIKIEPAPHPSFLPPASPLRTKQKRKPTQLDYTDDISVGSTRPSPSPRTKTPSTTNKPQRPPSLSSSPPLSSPQIQLDELGTPIQSKPKKTFLFTSPVSQFKPPLGLPAPDAALAPPERVPLIAPTPPPLPCDLSGCSLLCRPSQRLA